MCADSMKPAAILSNWRVTRFLILKSKLILEKEIHYMFFCKCTVNSVQRYDTDCVVKPAQYGSCLKDETAAIKVGERISNVCFLLGVGFGYIKQKVNYHTHQFPS